MKSRTQGSAHVVVVVILVIIIVAALGFIFWQNFIKANPTTPTTSTTTTETEATTSPKSGYSVSQWGITIPVTGQGYKKVENISDNPTHFAVTTDAIAAEAMYVGCDDTGLGQLNKFDSIEEGDPIPHSDKIAGYYYTFSPRSQVACADSNGKGPEKLNALMTDAIKDLRTAITHATAS